LTAFAGIIVICFKASNKNRLKTKVTVEQKLVLSKEELLITWDSKFVSLFWEKQSISKVISQANRVITHYHF
jgi:hypothetical protein